MKRNHRQALGTALTLLSICMTRPAWSQAKGDVPNQAQTNQYDAAQPRNYNYLGENPWYSHPSIRSQLQLSDQQHDQLNQAYGSAWNRYNANINGLDRNLTDQERLQRQQDFYSGFNRQFTESTNTVFPDTASKQRYNQLYNQYRWYGAFNDPTVREQLNLTPEQRQRFNQWDRDWNKQMNTWSGTYSTNPDVVNQQFNNAQQMYQQNLNQTLTPEQQQSWNRMTGKRFDLTPDVYFNNSTTTTTAKPVLK